MYNSEDIIRVSSISKKIDDIYTIIDRHNGIVKALNDIEGQPAILMLIIAISEQFSKLHKKQSRILENFDNKDIKGIIDVRNYIAHNYDGINLSMIENDLRYNMPRIKNIVNAILNNNNNTI
jgi:uncharacterized protein with HEPN domain